MTAYLFCFQNLRGTKILSGLEFMTLLSYYSHGGWKIIRQYKDAWKNALYGFTFVQQRHMLIYVSFASFKDIHSLVNTLSMQDFDKTLSFYALT